MKTMTKKLGAIILALAMCFSLCCVAFAADESSPYKINISNSSIDVTYTVYKVFDATYDPESDAVSYTFDASNTALYNLVTASGSPFTASLSADKTVYVVTANSDATDTTVGTWFNENIDSIVSACGDSVTSATGNGGTLTFYLDEAGYYLIVPSSDELTSAVVTVDTAAPEATVIDKNETVGGDKFHKYVKDSEGNLVNVGDAAMGDELSFDITSNVPLYEGDNIVLEYVFTDTLADDGMEIEISIYNDEGWQHLTDNGNNTWTADESLINQFVTFTGSDGTTTYYLSDIATDYSLIFTGCTYDEESGYIVATGFTLTYYTYDKTSYDAGGAFDTSKYPTDLTIDIIYSTYVTTNANHDETNTVELQYFTTKFNNPDPTDPKESEKQYDSDEVYSWDLKIVKVDGSDNTSYLEGAEFTLVGDNLNHVKVSTTVTYTLIDPDEMQDGVTYYYLLANGRYTTVAPTSDTADEYDPEYPGPYVRNVVTNTVEDASDEKHTADGQTAKDGTLTFDGLTAGTYTLTEIVAPDGYNLLDEPITIVIKWVEEVNSEGKTVGHFAVDTESSSDLLANASFTDSGELSITITNNAGTELPSTGGIGTTIFYIIGGVLVAGAVVVLITRRRMSNAD